MKKFLCFSFIFISTLPLCSQSGINADCINAIPLCSNPSFTFNSVSGVGTYTDLTNTSAHNFSNPNTNPASSNSGCLLAGELKPQWLLITIGNAGSLEFVFGASNSQYPQAGLYDWAMWKYTPTTCANIQNNTLAPVRCNWNGSGSGGTGIAPSTNLPPGGSQSNFEPPLAVQACEQYIICISNYSGINTLVSFLSTGSASLSCNPNCLNVTNAAICAGSSATIVGASSSSLTNITYSLNPGALTSNTPTFVVTPSVSTTYTFYATGQGQTGPLTQTAVSNVTVHPQPVVSPTFTNSTCTNTFNAFNLNLTFSPGGSPGYTVTWASIPQTITNNTQIATPDSTTTPPGVYTATITTDHGCSTVTSFTVLPQPTGAEFGFSPAGPVYSVTCYQPTVTITALVPSYNYTWTNGLIAQQTGSVASMNFTGLGTWTVTGVHPFSGCVTTRTIIVGQNVTTPSSALTPTFQNITCTLTSVTTVTATALSPTVNFSHVIVSPFGGSVTSSSGQLLYQPGGVGTFTHYLVNTVNGCSTGKTFTVSSSQGFPTFTLTSPQNFTLGCNSRSMAILNIVGAQATPSVAGAVSYTLLFPNSSSVTPNTTLSIINTYSVTVPGTYTVITKNNANMCETRVPVTILSNTFAPGIDTLIVKNSILTCYTPTTILKGASLSPNVNYRWLLPGNLSQAGDTLSVGADFSKRTTTVVGTYIFRVEDNSSTCTSTLAVPIVQNIFAPRAQMVAGSPSITCKVLEIYLSNISESGIPAGVFPKPAPIIGYNWEGPSPQERFQLTSTYLASTAGVYSMTAMDLNNGCTSNTMLTIHDGRNYPLVNNPVVPPPAVLDCGADTTGIRPIITSETANLSYQWTAPAGAVVKSFTTQVLQTNMVGDYRVLIIEKVRGCSTSVVMKVVAGKLNAAFDLSDSTGYAPLDVDFTNRSSSSLGTASITTIWNFGNGMDSTLKSVAPVKTRYTQPGRYRVTMYVQKGECLDTVEKFIEVEIPSRLKVPNVFTPNGDGVNDEFFLHTANLESIEMMIVDRWGRKVFEVTSGSGNVLWDGKDQKGKILPDGAYYFVLKATGKDGRLYEEKGSISLLR